jgi:hypothetical protein
MDLMRFVIGILTILFGGASQVALPQNTATPGADNAQSVSQQQAASLAATLVPITSDALQKIGQLVWDTAKSLQQEQATPAQTPEPDTGLPLFWPQFLSPDNVQRYIRIGQIDLQETSPAPVGTPPVPPAATAAPAAIAQGGVQVWPILENVVDNGDGTFTAYFGYENKGATAVTIRIGPDNQFTPAPASRGQPTTFAPGRSAPFPQAAFSVVFQGGTLTWTLKGRRVTAVVFQ